MACCPKNYPFYNWVPKPLGVILLLLLFIPILSSPDPSNFQPEGTTAMWFWLAWVAGGLVCGIVSIMMDAFGEHEK